MLKNFDELKETLKKQSKKKRLVVAAAQDKYSLEAVCKAAKEGFIEPILVGDSKKINDIAKEKNLDISKLELIEEKNE